MKAASVAYAEYLAEHEPHCVEIVPITGKSWACARPHGGLESFGDNALLRACAPSPERLAGAIVTAMACGVLIGFFWYLCVALRAGA